MHFSRPNTSAAARGFCQTAIVIVSVKSRDGTTQRDSFLLCPRKTAHVHGIKVCIGGAVFFHDRTALIIRCVIQIYAAIAA